MILVKVMSINYRWRLYLKFFDLFIFMIFKVEKIDNKIFYGSKGFLVYCLRIIG